MGFKINSYFPHDFTTFINDTLVFGKWHKIPAGGSVHLAQTETPARFLSDICKTPHPDTVIVSWHSIADLNVPSKCVKHQRDVLHTAASRLVQRGFFLPSAEYLQLFRKNHAEK